ncbi:unnamed protein product [Caenorhabditis auriculariae]|uniref:Uncharacterized protein n=1 Tax=Caenorhabditis auriculariae TaxID=2777116 RepID=A0A8S1H467_9PELO|nr:unnamed protein product [Caenorhabditis auriculariae]
MVFAGITADGKTPLIFVDPGVKVNQPILTTETDHRPSSKTAPRSSCQRDSRVVSRQFSEFISAADWPASSPDLNPMDYAVWIYLTEKVSSKNYPSIKALKTALIKKWDEIDDDYLRAVIVFVNQSTASNMKKGGSKRRREDDDGDVSMTGDDDDSRSGAVKVEVPKGKEKEPEFTAPKGQKLTDLDDEGVAAVSNANGNKEPEGNLIEQTHFIVVPSYSAWFDYNAIHQIEKRALPEFFNGKNKSKTPEVFLSYRNFMIDTYRLNPFEYISATACRRNLAGDVGSIYRLHAFLEQWGLINYQVDAESRPAPIAPPPSSHFMVLADTPTGVQPLNPMPPSSLKDEKKGNGEGGVKAEPGSISEVGLKTDQYQKQLAAMKTKGALPGRDWTDQETVLLLEGLEMFKDDWNKVCDHVGTRTQDECILRFLQLPIQDPYLNEDDGGNGESGPVLGPLSYQPVPFSQSGNPVMSTVAFLASAVDPRVAAAATKGALEEFSKLKEEIPPLVLEAHVKNVQAHADKTGFVDGTVGLSKSGIAATDEEAKQEDEERMDTTESNRKTTSAEARGAIKEAVQAAAATALGAAAVKAKHLALIEERRIKSLVAQLVETQMKKLEMKLRHFDELEQIMDKEREALEYQRQQLILERQAFHMDQLKYLENRAKHEAHTRMTAAGTLPAGLPPGFEVTGPPQPTPQTIPSSQDPTQNEKMDTSDGMATSIGSTAAPPRVPSVQPPSVPQQPPQQQPPPAIPPGPPQQQQQQPQQQPQQQAPQQYGPPGGYPASAYPPPPRGYPSQGQPPYSGYPSQGYPGQPAPAAQAYYGAPGQQPGYPPQQGQPPPGAYPPPQRQPYGQPGQPPYQAPPQRPGYGSYQGHYGPPGQYGGMPPGGYPPQGVPQGPPQGGPPSAPSAQMDSADAATPPMHHGQPDVKQE